MSRPTWIRLYHGRLWHLYESPVEQTIRCGEGVHLGLAHEIADGLPPTNAQVCERCVKELREEVGLAMAALERDPRRRNLPLLPLTADVPSETSGTAHLITGFASGGNLVVAT